MTSWERKLRHCWSLCQGTPLLHLSNFWGQQSSKLKSDNWGLRNRVTSKTLINNGCYSYGRFHFWVVKERCGCLFSWAICKTHLARIHWWLWCVTNSWRAKANWMDLENLDHFWCHSPKWIIISRAFSPTLVYLWIMTCVGAINDLPQLTCEMQEKNICLS